MSQQQLRERRRGAPSTTSTDNDEVKPTQYPHLVKQLVEPWYEFEADQTQRPPSRDVEILEDTPRRDAIIAAFKLRLERDAFGSDEYHPIEQSGTNLSEAGGIGYTVVDAIDTMVLMGLQEEELRAREWVEKHMDLDRDGNFNMFETTIRVLGGLLSAHHLTNAPIYLDRAVELADRLMPAFDTSSGIPWSLINLGRREGVPDEDNQGLSSTAEAATLQLEFKYLSYLTDNDSYWRAAEKVMDVIKQNRVAPGLAPILISPAQGQFVTSAIRLGSRGDSYYEYLLKQHLQTDRKEPVYREMYDDAMEAISSHLLKRSMYSNLLYTSELIPERTATGSLSWRLVPKQDHLVCFLGGSLMLGATDGAHTSIPPKSHELSPSQLRDWNNGVELIKTCMATHDTKTRLSPEIVHFRLPSDPASISSLVQSDWYIKGLQGVVSYDARYILRPETVESLFIAYRLTGDNKYREWGWDIFSAIEKHCKISSGGYASILNVDAIPVEYEDKMETFLLSETLKYLFLLFSDGSVLPLDRVVFNTEAHPLPVFEPHLRTGFS
ncbi:glycoside hydrolase family 47 protein [Hysterangium stoloniferum]|nr:glycoside hydrolase family 47 protein [Hysterangium stoloniferum]